MAAEPESLIPQLLREIRANVAGARDEIKSLREETKGDLHSLRADAAADILALHTKIDQRMDGLRKDIGEQIVGLRRAVIDYHTSVIGHGALISDLEARLRRVELHLNLPPSDTH